MPAPLLIVPFLSALIKTLAIMRVVRLMASLALIAWFFNWISVPASMLNFEWPMKDFFAPIFHYLGVAQGLAMISTAYTTRWTYEAFRLALK